MRSPPDELVSARPAVRCAWCGSTFDGSTERLRGRARCPACGVATTDPWPTGEELEQAYADWYRPERGRFSGPGDLLLRRSRGALAGRLERIAPPGGVLDFGAGDGTLIDALRARGREALGIERHSPRPDMLEADLAELSGGWAAVVFWHSLEHLPDPAEALRNAARLLKPRGVLVAAMPNAASLQARAFGDRWLALDLPRHLVHVPAAALLERLPALGLAVERVSYVRGGQVVFGWAHGLVGLLPGRPDLYDAIRRPAARRRPMSAPGRAATLAAGAVVLPAAAVCAGVEVALRRGGSVYVEARRG
jgi:SAM-dependent methyltransferase